jgi:hypothetical protein
MPLTINSFRLSKAREGRSRKAHPVSMYRDSVDQHIK